MVDQVELSGLEPLTSCMPWTTRTGRVGGTRCTNWASA